MKKNFFNTVYFPDFKGGMQALRNKLPYNLSSATNAQLINHLGHAHARQGVVHAMNRSEALIHTGLEDVNGSYLYLRLTSNSMVCGKEFKFCGILNEDAVKKLNKYSHLPASPFVNDSVDLGFLRKIKRVEASGFHLFHDHSERWNSDWDANRVVAEAESILTKHSNSVLSYYTLRHGFQYLLPVKGEGVFLLGVWNEEAKTLAIVTKLTQEQVDFDLMLGDAARALAA